MTDFEIFLLAQRRCFVCFETHYRSVLDLPGLTNRKIWITGVALLSLDPYLNTAHGKVFTVRVFIIGIAEKHPERAGVPADHFARCPLIGIIVWYRIKTTGCSERVIIVVVRTGVVLWMPVPADPDVGAVRIVRKSGEAGRCSIPKIPVADGKKLEYHLDIVERTARVELLFKYLIISYRLITALQLFSFSSSQNHKPHLT